MSGVGYQLVAVWAYEQILRQHRESSVGMDGHVVAPHGWGNQSLAAINNAFLSDGGGQGGRGGLEVKIIISVGWRLQW